MRTRGAVVEGAAAVSACVAPLAGVHAPVLAQMRHLSEGLVTLCTCEWLLASVDALVLGQQSALAEEGTAFSAHVKLLAGVHARVLSQVRLMCEGTEEKGKASGLAFFKTKKPMLVYYY